MNTLLYNLKEKDRNFRNAHPLGMEITRKVALSGALIFTLVWVIMVLVMMLL